MRVLNICLLKVFGMIFIREIRTKKKLSEYVVRKKRTISGYGCLTYKVSNGYLSPHSYSLSNRDS